MIVDKSSYIMSLILVLIGCIFRDFIIPLFVWKNHLKNKNYGYRFWFCVITQATIQISLVLLLGILDILNGYTFIGCNILIYILIIWNYTDKGFFKRRKDEVKSLWSLYKEKKHIKQALWSNVGRFRMKLMQILHWPIWKYIKSNWLELMLLVSIVVYNIWFLTYNLMYYHSYQFSDIPVHQSWIYEMEKGTIYSDGIYPFGMHVMIYFIRTIFRINLREILLYAGAYQFVILIIGIYLLAKKIFAGRYTPIAAILIATLMLKQGRYAASLPQEAGMYAVIAIVYFMVDYLHKDKEKYLIESDSKIRRFFRINSYINRRYIRSELILLMLSVALVISYHYYTAIAAVFLIIAIGMAYIPKIFKKQYFIPLIFSGIVGVAIWIVPTGVALVKGIPFQKSIEWATTVMSGEEWHGSDADYQDKLNKAQGKDIEKEGSQNTEELVVEKVRINYSQMTIKEIVEHYLNSIYDFGASVMFGLEQTKLVFACMVMGFLFALMMLLHRNTRNFGRDYIWLIINMFVLFTIGASRSLGIPEIIAADRVSTFAQPLVGIMYIMPFDFFFRILGKWKNPYYQKLLGTLSLAICGFSAAFIINSGWYHNFFDINQAYYNESEYVLRNIKKSFKKYSYTIVSTTDEYYDVLDYGRHTEMSKFINMINKNEEMFTFTTDYVFFFIEKTTLQDYNYGRTNVSLEHAARDYIYMADVQDYYFQRATIQSQAYYWAKAFQKIYPRNFKVYFEDDIYIVYFMEQNTYYPYNLQIDYLEEYRDLMETSVNWKR